MRISRRDVAVAAFSIALTCGERRRNPDRADRSQETVHDRVPI